jgi:hypothetical protein
LLIRIVDHDDDQAEVEHDLVDDKAVVVDDNDLDDHNRPVPAGCGGQRRPRRHPLEWCE